MLKKDIPLADWVNEVSEGKAQYLTKKRKRTALKKEFYEKRK
jgi:hypothetical protein